jgi:hypothetical protein
MSDDEFRRDWFGARETVAGLLNEWDEDVDLGDMEIQALQTVAFGFERMLAFAEEVGADMSELPTREDLEAALRLVADVDGDGRQPQEHQFLSLVSRAAAADYLESDTDYRVVHEGKPNEDLRVNVTRAFDKVSKFARDHALNEDLLQSAADYKDRFGQLEEEDTFVTTTSQPTPPINRCVGVDMSRAVEDVVGFARESFIETVSLDEGEDAGSDGSDGDGDGDGPTPVKELDPEETDTGYATVTVRATAWNDGDDAPLPLTGTVKDETGPVRVVSFDEVSTPVDEDECIRIKDAFVDDYDGRTQLVIEDGTTEIESIQPGAGHTAPVETPDDQTGIEPGSQTGLPDEDDSGETVNETTGDTTDAPAEADAFEAEQNGARADRGEVGEDTHSIDQTILQHAKDVETTAALAGRVTGKVECDDLATIKHHIETLQDRGDIILRDTDTGGDQNPLDVEGIYRHAVQRIVARTGSAATETAVRDCLRGST